MALGASAQAPAEPRLTFGLTADAHLLGRGAPQNEATVAGFVEEMCRWRPDFAIDMGDFGCQALPAEVPEDAGKGVTTSALHRAQLAGLEHHAAVFARVPCPRLHVLGNHDAGWLRGGGESITAADLIGRSHPGEDITKDEVLRTNGMPHRYYARQVAGILLIVLDANNEPDSEAPTPGHDGVQGAYYIDAEQRRWLKTLLAQHRTLSKLVFCHQELHHTPVSGSPEGGDVPFPVVGKEGSYVDNGWQIREMFAEDGRVLACFFGHKHRSRWASRHLTPLCLRRDRVPQVSLAGQVGGVWGHALPDDGGHPLGRLLCQDQLTGVAVADRWGWRTKEL